MAQENANVLVATLYAKAAPNTTAPLRCVAATGIDLATLQRLAGDSIYRFLLNEAISDDVLSVSISGAPVVIPNVSPVSIGTNWRRVPGDTTQRAFEVLIGSVSLPMPPPVTYFSDAFAIQFWRIPSIGPAVPFAP